MFLHLVLAFILGISTCTWATSKSTSCPRKARVVIDLGSGTTKLNVAEVEVCKERSRLIKMLDDTTSRPLALEASKDPAGNIPLETQNQTLSVLRELREIAAKKAAEAGFAEIEMAVVGTHAFRTAKNQSEFQKLMEQNGFAITALTQKDEAETGFYAVQGQGLPPGCDPNSLLVWDIGGGSMQLIRSPPPAIRVEGFNMGAEGFKQALMGRFKPTKNACAVESPSPNPIGKEQSESVRTFARDTTQRLLRGGLRRDLRATCVVGIGGVHSKAVSLQLEKSWKSISACVCKDSASACKLSKQVYYKVQLECLARHLIEKSDCDPEIKGPYSSTAVTNLYFVLGWMDTLGFERVHTRALNMGHHLVLAREELVTFKNFAIPGAK